ncbi:MAG: RNA polymerase sporulation sigma factor SigH [Clostridia bacterium]|nr:RNA polymerase sporulation sigma factor SigH [Clostridia bacterium]
MEFYYENYKDEEIVKLARKGDGTAQESLIQKYKKFVKNKAKAYFLIGADREDIIQEGMIGLFKAIRDYNEDKQATFKAFAEMCIKRQIITAIKSATRQKHIPLNSYVSLSKPIYEENSERTLMDMLTSEKVTDPETITVFKEELDYIESKVADSLSNLEWRVLKEYLMGKSYQEIAQDMNKPIKSIDNALQRVKRKLEVYIENRRY